MLPLHNTGPARSGVQTKPAMNLKTTLQTLRHIERLLDGWQSSGDIPAIERDLACDLLRRAYDDILFSDKNAATASEVSLAGNAPADRMNEKAVGESAGIPVDAVAATGDALVADVVSPNGLVRPAPAGEPAEGTSEESLENAEAVAAPAAENAPEVPAESPVEGNASVGKPVGADTLVEVPVEEPVSVGEPDEESVPVEEFVGKPVGADTLVEVPVEEPVSDGEPDEESVPVEEFVGEPVGADTLVEVSIEEPVSVGEPVDEPASIETSVVEPASAEESVEEHVPIETSVGAPVGEDTPVEVPVGGIAEEEIPVEEFGEAGEAGDAAGESGDMASSAEDVATSIPETSVDIVIDPVFEVFADEGEDAGEPDGTEETDDAEASETLGLVETVNVVEAVDAVGAAEDTETAGEMEIVEEMEAEETEVERPVAASAAMQSVTAAVEPVATTAEPAAEPGPESVSASAPAEASAGEAQADAAASNAETLEEMAARFKNASGRRRRSRRAFLSLYDDDETARRGERNDQLELSDWGVEPSDPSAKLRHARELFGLPVDDLDTASEPTPQPADESATVAEPAATDGEFEIEVLDFLGDDDLPQGNRNAKPAAEPPIGPATKTTSEPMTMPTRPTPCPTVAPVREERDDADDDLPFDEAVVALEDPDAPSAVPSLEVPEPLEHPESPESPEHPESPDADAVPFESIEIVEIADGDEETPGIEGNEAQHIDRAEVADEPARSEIAASAASAAEPAAAHALYGREEKPELPASTTVLGEVMGHDVPTVGDSLGRRPDVAGWADMSDDLNRAISVGDRFVLLRDLFDGDQALCDRTLKRLSTFDDLDDCMIWITENFAWNANSEGAKLIMGLLERKLG